MHQASPQEHLQRELQLCSHITRRDRCARARGRRLYRSAFTRICGCVAASRDESGVLVFAAGVSRGAPLPQFSALQSHRETSQVCSCSPQASSPGRLDRGLRLCRRIARQVRCVAEPNLETRQVCSCSQPAPPLERLYWELRLCSRIARRVRCARSRSRRLHWASSPGSAALQPYRKTSQVCLCPQQASP